MLQLHPTTGRLAAFGAGTLAMLALLGASACYSSPDLPPLPATAPVGEVRIQAGDELELKFTYTPELDSVQRVRPDGRISAPLIGDVDLAGLTPGEARAELKELYAATLRVPDVSVIIRSSLARRVFVGGFVIQPGVVEMPAELSVLEAIYSSGGFNEPLAEPRNVVVIRRGAGARNAFLVDLEQAWKEPQSDRFMLAPGDIIHVPQSAIASADQWVDQNLNRLIPEILRFGFVIPTDTFTE